MKKSLTIAAAIALMAPAMANAQNLMANKPVSLLGEAKTWTNTNESTFQVNVEELQKITAEPQNTSNIFLFPEGGGWNTEANQAIGIQAFYVDLESSQEIGTVTTTWEGAAADSYNIFVTSTVPTIETLNETPTYTVSNLGQYTNNTAKMPEKTIGQYVVFQSVKPTNWAYGVKIRSISAAAPQEFELNSFNVFPLFITSPETEMTFTFKDQFGQNMDASAITLTTSDNATLIDGKLTINSGTTATIFATDGNETIAVVVYATPSAPATITNTVKTAIYTDSENDVTWTTGYNGGCTKGNQIDYSENVVAMPFYDLICLFINKKDILNWKNTKTTVEQLGNTLCYDVYSVTDATITTRFTDDSQYQASNDVKAEEWTTIKVPVNTNGAILAGHSVEFIRIDSNDAPAILLANVYFFDDKSVPTGVSAVAEVEGAVNVYNMQGVLLKENVNAAEALEGLAKGMYVVGNKKVVK